jgi:hypothetical protein
MHAHGKFPKVVYNDTEIPITIIVPRNYHDLKSIKLKCSITILEEDCVDLSNKIEVDLPRTLYKEKENMVFSSSVILQAASFSKNKSGPFFVEIELRLKVREEFIIHSLNVIL